MANRLVEVEVIHQLSITAIVPSRWQPRTVFEAGSLLELAQDIKVHGVLVPLLVWQNEDGEYELIAGERRLRACYALGMIRGFSGLAEACEYAATHSVPEMLDKVKGWLANFPTFYSPTYVPCRMVTGEPAQLHEMALVDNLLRQDLSPIEEARALQDLMQEYGYSQRELARRIGKSQTYISQRLNLLHLHPDVAGQVLAGELDASVARDVARLEPEVQPAVVAYVAEQGFKSKKASNFVGKLLDLAEPAAWANGDDNRNAGRLITSKMQEMPVAGRQAAMLKYAQENTGTLNPPKGSWEYRRALHAVGISDSAYKDVEAVWREEAPKVGATCETCQLRPHLERIKDVLDRCETVAYWGCGNTWPCCGKDGVQTCPCYTAEGDLLRLRAPVDAVKELGQEITDEEKTHITGTGYFQVTDDVALWIHLNLRAIEFVAADRTQREDLQQNGIRRALARYVEFQDQIAADHVYSQPCSKCVFHKHNATNPEKACHFQQQLPDLWSPYPPLALIWQRSDGLQIGRCRLFRYRDLAADLPDLPGSVDIPAGAFISLVKGRAVTWLNVHRQHADALPEWSRVVEYLEPQSGRLTPGQRYALLLMWVALADNRLRFVTESKAAVWDPYLGAETLYQVVRSFSRDTSGDPVGDDADREEEEEELLLVSASHDLVSASHDGELEREFGPVN